MADHPTSEVRIEDVMPVRTRVGWGAVFAGAVVALASYLIFMLLGGALGLTIQDDVENDALAVGAVVWAIVATMLSLFLGGWLTTQCTVGETKTEAITHGIIMWGVTLAMILWLAGAGLRLGLGAMWGAAAFTDVAAEATTTEDWQAAARRAGVTQDQLDSWRESARSAPAEVRDAVTDPENQEAAAAYAVEATWYTLLGTVLSMAAAIGGALLGAGPTFRLFRPPVVAVRTVHEVPAARARVVRDVEPVRARVE
jgi:hypothetical protein